MDDNRYKKLTQAYQQFDTSTTSMAAMNKPSMGPSSLQSFRDVLHQGEMSAQSVAQGTGNPLTLSTNVAKVWMAVRQVTSLTKGFVTAFQEIFRTPL